MASRLFAVLPVKPFEEGKTRLAGLLNLRGRVALNRQLLDCTLDRLAQYPGSDHTVVVSRSDDVLRLARQRGCHTVQELPPYGLNAAVLWGVCKAREAEADAVVVMPVDLPQGSGEDLRRLVESAPAGPVCVLVPDHHGQGTNLLFQAPVQLDHYEFGPDSLSRHRQLAARAGLLPVVRDDSVFAFDIDEPADYLRWRPRGAALGVAGAACAAAALQPI